MCSQSCLILSSGANSAGVFLPPVILSGGLCAPIQIGRDIRLVSFRRPAGVLLDGPNDGLFVDAQGTLWINTHDGSMTALRNGVFTHEWQGGQVSAVFSRSNQIFFALLRGQLVVRNASFEEHAQWQSIPLAGVTAGNLFQQDVAGVLWYVTRDGALNRIDGTNSEPLLSKDFLNGEHVNCLTTDGSGHIWAERKSGFCSGTAAILKTRHRPMASRW